MLLRYHRILILGHLNPTSGKWDGQFH
jgi:hypothetical protein